MQLTSVYCSGLEMQPIMTENFLTCTGHLVLFGIWKKADYEGWHGAQI